jgi:hypothetical protein
MFGIRSAQIFWRHVPITPSMRLWQKTKKLFRSRGKAQIPRGLGAWRKRNAVTGESKYCTNGQYAGTNRDALIASQMDSKVGPRNWDGVHG